MPHSWSLLPPALEEPPASRDHEPPYGSRARAHERDFPLKFEAPLNGPLVRVNDDLMGYTFSELRRLGYYCLTAVVDELSLTGLDGGQRCEWNGAASEDDLSKRSASGVRIGSLQDDDPSGSYVGAAIYFAGRHPEFANDGAAASFLNELRRQSHHALLHNYMLIFLFDRNPGFAYLYDASHELREHVA